MTGKEFIWIVFLTGDSTSSIKASFHDGMFGEHKLWLILLEYLIGYIPL